MSSARSCWRSRYFCCSRSASSWPNAWPQGKIMPRGESMAGQARMIRTRIVISGRVQGVYFRASARDVARAHGVFGWVRNRAEGDVEALVEGE
ncbi:MAG TPA: acylphosphatase, partial [Gammaproteobacteria bacterium]|nr:acylphosphatase [Gammaproteobacteria bacterium]